MTSLFLNNSVRKYFGLCYHMCASYKTYDIVQLLFTDVLVPVFPRILCSNSENCDGHHCPAFVQRWAGIWFSCNTLQLWFLKIVMDTFSFTGSDFCSLAGV